METVAAVADADANVLIVGESGTGKELIANALHERSRRRDGPWIKINCAALPKDLIESELFGHTRGLVHRRHHREGRAARGGRTAARSCSTRSPRCRWTCRPSSCACSRSAWCAGWAAPRRSPSTSGCITSTNRSPDVALKDGRLRQDLYFRINTVTIEVPPLRERREDLPMLVRAFLERYRAKHAARRGGHRARRPTGACWHTSWPGNVRELQHAIERAVLVTRGRDAHAGRSAGAAPARRPRGRRRAVGRRARPQVPAGSLEEIERASILKALETTRWNKQAAAALLGLRRPTLYSKMRKHSIPQRRA